MAAPRKHRLNVPPPEQTAGRKAGSGTVGYPNQPFSVPQSASLGLGTQAGAPPPGAPAAAASGGGAPPIDLSWLNGASWADIQYFLQLAQNVQQAGNNDIGYAAGRDRTLSGLGYNFKFDPSNPFQPIGGVDAAEYDPTNPFSQATQLRTHYEAAKRGDTNNLAARGQLYSGALGNQLGLDQSSYNQSDNALISAAQNAVADAIANHQKNVIQFGPAGNTGQAGLDAQLAALGRQKPGEPVVTPSPATGPTAAPKAKYAGTPTDLPPVRRYTGTSFVPQGGVVPGVKPKPYAKPRAPKPYTGKSFVPFGGK